jgi:hypothetical protein
MNKYEQLIEHIINDETDKARELFHNIVVEKSRDIYESLIDETDLGGNPAADFAQSVKVEEEGLSEEEEGEEESAFGADDEGLENDFDDSGDLDAHEEEHGDVDARVDDLEAALDELKAEFDALMAGEEHEEEEYPGIHGEEEVSAEEAPEEFYEAEECDSEEEDDEEELDETIVREYVEKVSAPSNTEGADNKTSIVAKKNDMGGTSANIVKGGTENGGTVKKPAVNNAGNINVPGGKAGNAFAKKEKAPAAQAPSSTNSPVAK